MNAVADSNHTCDIDIASCNDPDKLKANKGEKIYYLLSAMHRDGVNVRHLESEFEDDSLKLVPKVLESVNIYAEYGSSTGDVHPLSIMYEILRSWKMPTLYETS